MPAYRFLIIPGFAKAGTSFIENQMRRYPDWFNFPPVKEIGLFRHSTDLHTYLTKFTQTDPTRTFVDASPMYVDPWYGCFEKIKTALYGHKIHLNFCFRSPIQRAYSHYVHDIRGAILEFGFERYVFEDPRVMSRYLLRHLPIVESAVRFFGAENVSGTTLDAPLPDLSARAKAFIGAHAQWTPDAKGERFAGGWLPRIFYSARAPLLVTSGDMLYELPRNSLLVSSGHHSVLLFDVPDEMGERMVACSESWTRQFDTSVLRHRRAEIFDDYYAACRMAGVTPVEHDDDEVIRMDPPPPLPEGVTQQLRALGKVGMFVTPPHGFSGDQPFDSSIPSFADDHIDYELKFQDLAGSPSAEHAGHRADILDLAKRIVDQYGMIPARVETMLIQMLILHRHDEFLAAMAAHPAYAQLVDRPKMQDRIRHFAAHLPQEKRDQMLHYFE